jgi:hypothetical protein
MNSNRIEDQTFYFRRRTNATSFDSYDCLTTTRNPVASDSHYQQEYWSNGNTLQYLNMSDSSSITTNDSTNNDMKQFALPPTMISSNNNEIQTDRAKRRLAVDIVTGRSNENEIRDSILAGSLAGIASCSVFHPFDVIRTKMQVSTKVFETSSSSAARQQGGGTTTLLTSVNPKKSIRSGITSTSGPFAVMTHTFKNGGIRAFYTGISLPLAAQAMYKSTVFTINRISKNVVIKWKTNEQRKTGIFQPYELTLADRFVCGSVSGAANALLFVCPVEFVRNQLIQQHTLKAKGQTRAETYMKGPTDVIRKTLKNDGIFGLWKGAGVTLVRDSIGCGAFFLMNELGKKNISNLTGYEEGTLVNSLGSGAMAGFGYWFVSLPLDALKTLVQTGKATSAQETVSVLVKRDGALGATTQLYRGWQLAFGRGSLSAALTLTTYSTVYNFCSSTFA